MVFRLVVADIVDVPLTITLNDAGRSASFAFHLQARRLSQDRLRELVESDVNTVDFLLDHVTGWRGQRLVVDDDDTPAEFSREALACMLDLVGVAQLMLSAYLEACGAKGKAKN